MELEVVENVGWNLTLEKEKEEIHCFYCGQNIGETPLYFCKKQQKFICKPCNKKEWKGICLKEDEHEHFHIINIKWN